MATLVHSNGSKWAGEEPDTIEALLGVLDEYTLDPRFEECGNFCWKMSDNTGDSRLLFFGNFATLSHAFRIETDDPETQKSLLRAIRKNQCSEDYARRRESVMGKLIPQRTTDKYPVRYQAFDHDREWWRSAEPKPEGGREWDVYHEGHPNLDCPHLVDGIYVSVSSYQDKDLLLDCSLTLPVQGRKQFGHQDRFPYSDRDKAMREGMKWIRKSREKIANAYRKAIG